MEKYAKDNSRARQLRKNMTDAERRLWSGLRDRRLDGLKFRRQVALGPYYADFMCFSHLLIVELDGSQHQEEEQFWYDYRRTKYLERLGYRVMRFQNVDVLRYPVQVLEQIWAIARERRPHPSPGGR